MNTKRSRLEYLRDLITNCKLECVGMKPATRMEIQRDLGWTILENPENFKLIIQLLNKEIENGQVQAVGGTGETDL